MIGGSLPVRPGAPGAPGAPGVPAPPVAPPVVTSVEDELAPATLRRGEVAAPAAFGPAPTAAGPTAAGPTVPGPTRPGPTRPGPTQANSSRPVKSKFSSTVAFEASPNAQQQLSDALGVPDSAQPQAEAQANATVAFGAVEEPAPTTPRGLGGEDLKETAPETPYGRQPAAGAPSRVSKSKFSSTVAFEASPQAQQQLEQAVNAPGTGAATRAFDAIPASAVELPAGQAGPAAPRQGPAASKFGSTVAFTGGDDIRAAQQAAAQQAAAQQAAAQPAAARPQDSAPPKLRTEKSHLSSTIAFESTDVKDAVEQAQQMAEAKQQAQPPAQQGTQAFAPPGNLAEPAGSPGGTAGPTRTGRSHLSSTLAFIPPADLPRGPSAPIPAAGQPAPAAPVAPAAPPAQAAPFAPAAPPAQPVAPVPQVPPVGSAAVIDVHNQPPADPAAQGVDATALLDGAEVASQHAKKKSLSSKKRTMLGGMGELGPAVDQARAEYAAAQSGMGKVPTDLGVGPQPGGAPPAMPHHGTDLGVGPEFLSASAGPPMASAEPGDNDASLAATMASPSAFDPGSPPAPGGAAPGPTAGAPGQPIVPGQLAPSQPGAGYPLAPGAGHPAAPAGGAAGYPAAPGQPIPGQFGVAPPQDAAAPAGYPPAPGGFGMGPGPAQPGLVPQGGMPMPLQPQPSSNKKMILIVVGAVMFVLIVATVMFVVFFG